jgi:hypothetical protein
MHGRVSFESNPQAAKLMQPSNGTLHHPSRFAQSTAVLGAPTGNLRGNAPARKLGSEAIGIVGSVCLKYLGFTFGRTWFAADSRHGLEQGFGLSHIVAIGLGQKDGNRDALRFREYVVLAARTTAIGWVRSTFFPAPTARIDELSAMAREKSSFSAPRSWLSNSRCRRSQTRAFCHALSRRQQVMPEPQPICVGNIFQGMPERRTNRMPPSTLRSHSGSRPVCRLRLRFFGSNGSICAHSSSSTKGCGMTYPLDYAMP